MLSRFIFKVALPSGALGVGSSMPISFNFASVCTPHAATRTRPTTAAEALRSIDLVATGEGLRAVVVVREREADGVAR